MRRDLRYVMPSSPCAICGEERTQSQVWFLVTESHRPDRLLILEWQENVAEREGMYGACCPAHVEELAIHWMTTGSLNFPFAKTAAIPERTGRPIPLNSLPTLFEPDTRGARQIGELAVHRKSIARILSENPQSLQLILDELTLALEREIAGAAPFDSTEAWPTGIPRRA